MLLKSLPRMNLTMEKMSKMEDKNYSTLMRVLFGLDSPTPLPEDLTVLPDEFKNISFFDHTLNDSQKDAVQFALASKEVALIHGPPGVRLSSPHPIICLLGNRQAKPTLSSS